jgi:hypothetical protein
MVVLFLVLAAAGALVIHGVYTAKDVGDLN